MGGVERAEPVNTYVECDPVKDAHVRQVLGIGDPRPHRNTLGLETCSVRSTLRLGPPKVSGEGQHQDTAEDDQDDRPPRHRDEDRQRRDDETAHGCLEAGILRRLRVTLRREADLTQRRLWVA